MLFHVYSGFSILVKWKKYLSYLLVVLYYRAVRL